MKSVRHLKLAVCLLVSLLGFTTLVAHAAQTGVTYPKKPTKENYFVDEANLINEADRKAINQASAALLQQEKIPLFVVTIPSVSTYNASSLGVDNYARELFNAWGIGSKARNYGILLLVSAGDRKARIEFGAGFEHKYDNQAVDIMQSLIIPAFKRGDYSTGISDGVKGLDAMARGLQLPRPQLPKWFFPVVIGCGILFFAMLYNLFKSGRYGWAWALIGIVGLILYGILKASASGGSGGGFGGGFSGGGGASGSW